MRRVILPIVSLALAGCSGLAASEQPVWGTNGEGAVLNEEGTGTGNNGKPSSGPGGGASTPGNLPPGELPEPPPNTGAQDTVEQRQPMRRLSHSEYWNTLRDLFPGVNIPRSDLAPDEKIDGFSNSAITQQPSPLLSEQYFNVARDLVSGLSAEQVAQMTGCDGGDECARSWLRDFGTRAFRRPVTDDELNAYLTVFQTDPADFGLGVRLAIIAVLQSPQFLYRPEFGDDPSAPVQSVNLTPYEVASRLSYLVWGSIPDDELLAAAAADALTTTEQRLAQVKRMLGDEKAKQGLGQFFNEWLRIDKIRTTLKKPEDNWDDAFRGDVAESASRMVFDEIFAKGGTAADVLLSTRYPVTPRVAEVLGVTSPGEGWNTVTVPQSERAGLLTHPAFLAAHGYGGYPSPVQRGVFLMDRMLCAPPSPPPGDVAITLPEENTAEPRTNREAYALATSTGGTQCVGCHTAINGFGFAFENYDTLGRYRTEDNGFPVDASGNVASFDFANAVEFVEQLAESDIYLNCLVEKWLHYSLGGSELSDSAALHDEIFTAFSRDDFALENLVTGLAASDRYSRLFNVPPSDD